MEFRYPLPGQLASQAWRRLALKKFDWGWTVKARFLLRSYLQSDALSPILHARPGSSLHRYVQQRPDTSGFLVWPYQCASWGAAERLRRIAEHFDILDDVGAPFPLSVHKKLLLWNLDARVPGVRIILDQPQWLFREGMLAISLFCGNHRAYSLAFSLFRHGQGVGAFIGGLQGRRADAALERYRDLTKVFHGLRPRDLLLECFKMTVPLLKARRVFAVADDHRYVRHPYFEGARDAVYSDYDAVWRDRGGTRVDASHFELPMDVSMRDVDEVPSKKRAQYRRRNEILQALQATGPALRSGNLLQFEAT